MTQAKRGEILYQGHASLRIITKAGTVVYVDPYAGEGYDVPADLILVTHEHYDHNAVEKPAKKPTTVIWRESEFLSNGWQASQLGSKTFHDVDIQAVEAYNGHHPRGFGVGYVLSFDDISVYVSGDTSKTSEMPELAKLHLDYAFLPIDGIYNMGPAEMMACAKLIGAKHVIPYHMDPGHLFNEADAEKVTLPNVLIVPAGGVIDY